MKNNFSPEHNYINTKKITGYVEKKEATRETYSDLGFKCGHEIHQQLKTKKKLFCRCPAGIYHDPDDFNAEILRHMRPTLSELGEYDGTALMEFKTKKNITYRINNQTACTYDIDDTPPFPLNREALDIAIEVALLLKTNVVGELHITRKQYLDGSIPTGFQRTAIVGIEGEIPLKNKKVRIIQLSIEEESCREVSDIGHERIYTTDRLGIPLIETVTYPDLLTPDEAAEAAHYIRFLTRSTGKVQTGIGAAREDVNVSIDGGTRVEIKGVAHIARIPLLTHNEAFRQKALLEIKKTLNERFPNPAKWKMTHKPVSPNHIIEIPTFIDKKKANRYHWVAVNLPGFKGILSFFTQPGKSFANELSDRLKVIACIEKPNMIHSEPWYMNKKGNTPANLRQEEGFNQALNGHGVDFAAVRKLFKSGDNDAQLILWGPEDDIATAIETIEERCKWAFEGVPNETRKSIADGTTIFERVLPGPNRMYPDTDSPPIPIEEDHIQGIRKILPREVSDCMKQMKKWQIPGDTFCYLLKRNLFPLVEKIVEDFNQSPKFIGSLIGHHLKYIEGQITPSSPFTYDRIYHLVDFIIKKKLKRDILKQMLPVVYQYPNMDFESVLTTIEYKPKSEEDILDSIPVLKEKFSDISNSENESAMIRWVMGQLRPPALGNMRLSELHTKVAAGNGGNDE
ncbi:MAG: Glu-tRNA(Gln) amidotransferase subunit GatE [Candidatus Aminicenantes bacterium]|nr:Glu-tRNA(Gln) amidotransferase subunit GatE [Candidatus Aminicenantes bacterium]